MGEGARASSGGTRGKFPDLGARSGPRTGSTHLIPSQSDVLKLPVLTRSSQSVIRFNGVVTNYNVTQRSNGVPTGSNNTNDDLHSTQRALRTYSMS